MTGDSYEDPWYRGDMDPPSRRAVTVSVALIVVLLIFLATCARGQSGQFKLGKDSGKYITIGDPPPNWPSVQFRNNEWRSVGDTTTVKLIWTPPNPNYNFDSVLSQLAALRRRVAELEAKLRKP